ncbi:MAG: hypothetical protein DRJ03_27670 [Chloroflexi bacterium]|nr:MAG: hypothetical protein DRJ03_27670 [Chloroflexota bacterium]
MTDGNDGNGHSMDNRQAFREAEALFDDLKAENNALRQGCDEAMECFDAIAALIGKYLDKVEARADADH